MSDSTITYKCPNCGAALKYSAAQKNMCCEFCDSTFDMETLDSYNEILRQEEEQTQPAWNDYVPHTEQDGREQQLFLCQSCGAQLLTDENTVATICPYCGGTTVLSSRVSGELLPDMVIPFKVEKKQAQEIFARFCKGKFLLPRHFVNEQRLEELTGLYVPFWLFDAKAQADCTYNATTVHTYRRGDYRITDTRHYLVRRQGEAEFCRIPVDGSVKMEDDYMEAIEPFDYRDAIDFDAAYLSGFLADKYDVDSQAAMPRANERIKETAAALLRETVHGYASVTNRSSHVGLSDNQIHYALLPVWMLSTKYKNKIYRFAVNGQTGKMVGELPVDNGRFWGLVGAIAGAVALLGAVLAMFL